MHVICFLKCAIDIVIQLNKLPEQNITLTSIYRSFIEADTVKSTDDVKDSDADAFDVDALMLPIRDNVEAAYVKQFNSDVMKKLSLKVLYICLVSYSLHFIDFSSRFMSKTPVHHCSRKKKKQLGWKY